MILLVKGEPGLTNCILSNLVVLQIHVEIKKRHKRPESCCLRENSFLLKAIHMKSGHPHEKWTSKNLLFQKWLSMRMAALAKSLYANEN